MKNVNTEYNPYFQNMPDNLAMDSNEENNLQNQGYIEEFKNEQFDELVEPNRINLNRNSSSSSKLPRINEDIFNNSRSKESK